MGLYSQGRGERDPVDARISKLEHAPGRWPGFARMEPLQLGLTALAPMFLVGIAVHYANSLCLKRDHERSRRGLVAASEAAS